ncbi:MAG: FMN-binding negative transcriptional regulator [Rhizomicrobium sp.]
MTDQQPPSLFVPGYYAAEDPAAIVRLYPFALLVTHGSAGIHATSIPIFFESHDSTATLVGHMARRNPHANSLSEGQDVLAVFSGPHAYISASWYEKMPEVPTWNYVAAHVRGRIQPIDDPGEQISILRHTAAILERNSQMPWTLEQAPTGRVSTLLPMIRSFRIKVDRIEGVTKLSQTHPKEDRMRVAHKLLEQNDGNSHEIARLIRELARDA